MNELFTRFAPRIAAANPEDIRRDVTLQGALTLAEKGRLSISYAPFDHINIKARIVIAGITPGHQQARNALLEAHRQLAAGQDDAHVLKAAKETASFSGAMRPNLIALLDHIGLHRWLGIASCAALFAERTDLVHFTSVLRYPVFVNGQNYSDSPSPVTTPMLRAQVTTYLATEAHALRDAAWVPLGPVATSALNLLAGTGDLPKAHILEGLPHPSGANVERIAYFLGRKQREELSAKTNAEKLDDARTRLTGQVAALG